MFRLSDLSTCRSCGGKLSDGERELCGNCGVLLTFEGGVPLEPGPDLERLRAHAKRHGLPDPGPGLDVAAEDAWLDRFHRDMEANGGVMVVPNSYFDRPRRR